MKALIVLHGPFDCNSGIQVFHIANGLADRGWDVAVAAPSRRRDVLGVGEPRFRAITHRAAVRAAARWAAGDLVVHAWTPREGVRRVVERVVRATGAPYLVHLEDNEEHLLSVEAAMPYEELERLPDSALRRHVKDRHVHPSRYPAFMAAASGVTMVTEELDEFNLGSRPQTVAAPGVDPELFKPRPESRTGRSGLGLGPDEFVVAYHGSLHAINRRDMLALYGAIRTLRDRGRPVRLVRLGRDHLPKRSGIPPSLRADVVELGERPRTEVVRVLQMADAFVQPGAIDRFNRYRLPAKLPEFLAMGRPVLTPACNLGRELTDGANALLLREGSADEIATKLELLLAHPELARRLGDGAREFAVSRLAWSDRVESLDRFLSSALEAQPGGIARPVPRSPASAPPRGGYRADQAGDDRSLAETELARRR